LDHGARDIRVSHVSGMAFRFALRADDEPSPNHDTHAYGHRYVSGALPGGMDRRLNMKLHATMISYSGTAGGGLRLVDEGGKLCFLVPVVGVNRDITKEQTAAIASALIKGIPEPIEVPE
jgi:hypothetical protein